MLHIILMILKIIGIVILVILALLLAVTGVVLFVPIRYRVNGKKDEEGFFVKAEIYWLLHLFRMKAVYPEPGRIVAKVLWFTVYDSEVEGEKQSPQKARTTEAKAGIKERTKTGAKERNDKEIKDKEIKDKEIKERTEEVQRKRDDSEQNNEISVQKEQEPKKGKIGQVVCKIKAIIQKIFDFFKNIKYTIRRLCDKIKEIWANIQYYTEVFNEEETKRAFSMCKRQLFKIWKNIRPSKCTAELKIGTGEPDTTGYILAVHGMLYPLIGNNVTIAPDFENQVIEGTFSVKGRITVFVLLCAAIKLFFDEDIRHFLKRFKREE